MAVAFIDHGSAVKLIGFGFRIQHARILAKAHSAAHLLHVSLFRHNIDYGIRCFRIDFRRIGVFQPKHVSGEFNNSNLHAKADAEIRYTMRSGIICSLDLALNSPAAESAGHKDTVHISEHGIQIRVLRLQCFRIDPVDIHRGTGLYTAVFQRFVYRDITVVQFNIFSHHGNLNCANGVSERLQHLVPVRKIRFAAFQAEFFNRNIIQPLFVQHDRHGIKNIAVVIFNNAILFHIAEKRNLISYIIGKRMLCAAHDNIRMYAERKHFLNAVLGGLGFQFIRRSKIRHKRNMDKQAVFPAVFHRKLADRL